MFIDNLKDHPFDVPVILVGNKVDQQYDRMVTYAEGRKRCQELGCVAFHEISVREDVDQVREDLLSFIKLLYFYCIYNINNIYVYIICLHISGICSV